MKNGIKPTIMMLIMTVLCVAVVFCMSGCGGSTEWTMNTQEMAKNILDSVQFDTDMKQVKANSISTFMELPENYKGYMFMGDGSHSDCFGVFRFETEDDGKTAEKAIKKYLGELQDSFKRYIPEEADKVKSHSLVVRKGRNVVFVVCPDETQAEEIITAGIVESDGKVEEEPDNQEIDLQEPDDQEQTDDPAVSEETNEPDNEAEVTEPQNTETEQTEEGQTEENGDNEKTEPVKAEFSLDDYPVIETEKKLKYNGYIALVGRSAFEIYDYVDSVADSYAKLVNYTKKKLGDDVNVYDLIIPLASGVTVPNKYFDEIMGSNQRKALDLLYGKLKKSVIPVNIYETMMEHRDEYIYFRTDHHWTSLGAYYAYTKWCEESNTLPIPLEGRKKIKMGEFLGSLYNETKAEVLRKHPDKLVAYLPVSKAYISKKDSNGQRYKADIIKDYSDSSIYVKYDAFLGGDQGLVTIINKDVKDDSVLIIVKESFGNCMAPYFADHYHKVYVIDYRYFGKNIIDFAKKKGASDLIFINNIGMTRSSYLVGLLQGALKD
ncbi:MAG: DUF4358 domain-containing protein [Firmicutes bacterium]|nr:DUF4358 domain-containing protein [Bacillota bacterium]